MTDEICDFWIAAAAERGQGLLYIITPCPSSWPPAMQYLQNWTGRL